MKQASQNNFACLMGRAQASATPGWAASWPAISDGSTRKPQILT
tara:strand:- start:44521 stop:44652 length:132 start_codon:yes stop_codon:yes gene_type:complete